MHAPMDGKQIQGITFVHNRDHAVNEEIENYLEV